MKRAFAAVLAVCILLCGCTAWKSGAPKPFNAVYLTLFDTVTTILGTAESEEQFRRAAQEIYEELETYHRLFDIYHDYEGLNNLKTVNDRAGGAPVKVDSALIELLLQCKAYYDLTDGKVNAAMGSVLKLWHEARTEGLEDPENARLPDGEALRLAAEHINMDCVVIDAEASTVQITDPQLSLDVGAIAKGWACQKAAASAPKGFLISLGGNVCVTGAKDTQGNPWVIGIQHPERSDEYLHTLHAVSGSVVTSGDYQRVYRVDGKAYHHIIDPDTQMPSAYWRSVTVVCGDSALADALSTALFLLPLEEGRALAEKNHAQALWVGADGTEHMTSGFRALIAN